jgi:adenosylmethionine-8-amino-7-oxononanoate aminotransferase
MPPPAPPPPRPVLVRGEGCHVWDRAGRRYLDATSGAFCVNLGYTRPDLVEAMRRAAERLPFARASAFESDEGEAYRAELVAAVGPPFTRAVLTSSGSEAVDAAIKIAIAYQRAARHPERVLVRSLAGHYHGATLAALEVTGWEERRAPYAAALRSRIDGLPTAGDDRVAAFIAETVPVAGLGVQIPSTAELAARRAACDAAGALWIADEVLTGFGRCGAMFAWQRLGEGGSRAVPDLVVFGKGAGAGFAALAGVLVSARVAAALDGAGRAAFTHYQTYGGNPIACAVGRAALRALNGPGGMERALELEPMLRSAIGVERAPRVLGALAGFAGRGREEYEGSGLLVHSAGNGATVVAPPLTISEEDLRELADLLVAAER